jgi:Tol biopolymer transport system component
LFRSPKRVQGFSLSPDGKSVFYSEAFRLVRFDIETRRETELRKVETVVDSFYSVAVSPDGKQLAYVYWTGGLSSSVSVMPVDGGLSREVAQASPWADYGRYNALAWTADQRYLLFTPSAGENGQKVLWRVPVSGGPAEQMGVSMPGLSTPQIHPDGRRIFFASNDAGASEIWTLENFLPNTAAK